MIRKSFGSLAALALLLVAVNAQAAGVTLGLHGGIRQFTGDAGDALKTGFGGALTADYQINDMWAVGVGFGMNMVKHEDDGEDAAVVYPGSGLTGEISDKITYNNFGAHAMYLFPMGDSPIHPYVTAGLGMYGGKEKFETDNYSEELDIDFKFGFKGGVGATWMLNPQFGLGAEGTFHSVQTEGESTNFLDVLVGVKWVLPMGAK